MVAVWRCTAILLCICLLCGFRMQPKKDRYFYESRGDIVWEVPLHEKKIALTFDDGPYPKTTNEILDLLKQYNAKATFFVVGHRVKEFPDTIKREIAEGHEVANHTYNHVFLTKGTTASTIQKEIMQTEDSLVELTGKRPHLFRPPGGFYNERMIQISHKLGYTTVLWSWHQDTDDWRSPGVNHIVRKVLKNARNGDIVLLHDYIPGNGHTVQALRVILPELTKRGYKLVTVTELMEDKTNEMMRTDKAG
ncbi:polysaccharide deacetylase family protein [Paenibacillus silvisoli]|uniref:polysaccharide deacetylase family protein n=1 Tax=Paenibacillus silvisoli TaxID=3110539 RepID=UPI0028048C19|nr:polysaccharide deacetylase family protein [Paenibacillus silvisoli]